MPGINTIMSQKNEFSSYVKTVDERIGNLMKGIRQNSIMGEQLADEIQTSSNSLKQFITAASAAQAHEIAGCSYITLKLNTLRQAISDLAEDRLSPSLLQPKMIANTITEIEEMLIKQYPSYKLAVKK